MKKAAFGLTRTLVLASLAAAGAGCYDGGILITPVSADRAMVEKVLSRDSVFANKKIALLDVSGLILNAYEPRLIGRGEHQVMTFKEQLDIARRDESVKAVILRINSPGGGVVASELMHDELSHFRKTTGKPVVAMMMDVAASGGYYIACGCDEIVAQPSTVTGSIGVIMQMFNVSGTMELIGVTADAVTSGSNKDAGSPFRKMAAAEREIFQSIVNDMYERFVGVVKDGRPDLDEAQVRKLADGRVFSGSQALEHGLIDRIANMRQTIDSLKEKIGVEKIQLVTYMRPLAFKPNYYAAAPGDGSEFNVINVELGQLANYATPRFMYLWAPGR
ncbi:MAG: signal peptide peptidase SppA [Planctomycetota bacterium]|jgi:protease-4